MLSKNNVTALAFLFCASHGAWAGEALDRRMNALALNGGCFVCHQIESGALGHDGAAPIGPNWQDVAERYRGQKGATKTLVREVMQGGRTDEAHWKDKVTGLAMPPNAVGLTHAHATELVNWILALKKS
jgi:cytochrome c